MKKECSIIRDIFPLYVENMVSVDTTSFIEEHLDSCPECRMELEKIKNPCDLEKRCESISPAQENSALPLKTVRKKIHRNQLVIAITAILSAVSITAITFYILLFPPHEEQPLMLPAVTDVKGIEITNGKKNTTITDSLSIENLLRHMSQAQDSGKLSVQDIPAGDGTIWIHFILTDYADFPTGLSTIAMYKEKGKLFLEQPYQGIFSIDSSFADFVYEIQTGAE